MLSDITAIVPTSPIAAHPETALLQETLDSIRHHLPDCGIIITFDGVRAEQSAMQPDYREYIRRVRALDYGNVVYMEFGEHRHQTGMMRAALQKVNTRFILYVEHDTPLCTDLDIDWQMITEAMTTYEEPAVCRFHHESVIPEAHAHMVDGVLRYRNPDLGRKVDFVVTCQWSQRPHLARTDFYRRIMAECFTPEANCFIEDRMHSFAYEAYKLRGKDGWREYPIGIYYPDDGNMKRSYHTDGRAGGPKWEEAQVF